MDHEIWKPVSLAGGIYSVSNLGRVRGEERFVSMNGGQMLVPSRIYKGFVTENGYVLVQLKLNGKYRGYRVHRLVLEAFVGPCPEGHEACHGNGNRADNKLSNLRWDTLSGNQADRIKHGTANRGAGHPKTKLTEADILDIRRRYKRGKHTGLAREYGLKTNTIWTIATGRNWKHIPLIDTTESKDG